MNPDTENISLKCSFDESVIGFEKIVNILPDWKTDILEILPLKNGNINIKFCISATTVDAIKQWIEDYQSKTNTVYCIKSTEKCTGKYVSFKQRLHCQHRTRCSRVYEPYKKNKTRNTNCPANINITLRAVKEVYRGKDSSKAPNPEKPCEIVIQCNHNHETNTADALRFNQVSLETKEKLIGLFNNGHTPASALESIKMDIQTNNEEYDIILANRKFCPNYDYCYYLYMKEFKNKYGPIKFSPEFLNKRIEEYNNELNENSIQVAFQGTDYVICICPPLFRRVHKYIQGASEVVFMDSFGTVNQDGNRIFTLLTHSACGALPLCVMITSSESTNIISAGLILLKEMLKEDLFGGHTEGPDVFITDDSSAEQNSIKSVFKGSSILLCVFHVLQSVWRWLVKARNGIKPEDQIKLFEDFRAIMYAKSTEECASKYKEAMENASQYNNYTKYLQDYFDRRKLWALSYRGNLLIRGNNTNNYSKAAMRLLKDKLFEWTEAYNLNQTLDFIMTKFVSYYEKKLLDAAHNRTRKRIFDYNVIIPPPEIIEKIKKLTDEIYCVPSESVASLLYIVNVQILLCTCTYGSTGRLCKHIHWTCSFVHSEMYMRKMNTMHTRKELYCVASGKEPPRNWLLPLYSQHPSNQAAVVVESNVQICCTEKHLEKLGENEEIDTKKIEGENKNLIEEIMQTFVSFSETSPVEIGPALRKMKDNLGKLKTASAFALSCATFGSNYYKNLRKSRIPVEPTAISRRKKMLSGKASNVGGRLRKDALIINKNESKFM